MLYFSCFRVTLKLSNGGIPTKFFKYLETGNKHVNLFTSNCVVIATVAFGMGIVMTFAKLSIMDPLMTLSLISNRQVVLVVTVFLP